MKLGLVAVPLILMGITQTGLAATPGNFKRFSVSAGWLHVMPQGKANPFNINTAVANGRGLLQVGCLESSQAKASVFINTHHLYQDLLFLGMQ